MQGHGISRLSKVPRQEPLPEKQPLLEQQPITEQQALPGQQSKLTVDSTLTPNHSPITSQSPVSFLPRQGSMSGQKQIASQQQMFASTGSREPHISGLLTNNAHQSYAGQVYMPSQHDKSQLHMQPHMPGLIQMAGQQSLPGTQYGMQNTAQIVPNLLIPSQPPLPDQQYSLSEQQQQISGPPSKYRVLNGRLKYSKTNKMQPPIMKNQFMPNNMPGQNIAFPGQQLSLPDMPHMPLTSGLQSRPYTQQEGVPNTMTNPEATAVQASCLDPDQMPNPMRVFAGNQQSARGPFITNNIGVVPPLVTTEFTS